MNRDAVIDGLLVELAADERELIEAREELDAVRSRYEVKARKYSAIRDVVARYLNDSPYARSVTWPAAAIEELQSDYGLYKTGRFRFLYMPAGQAVVEALKESTEPLNAEEVIERLLAGGMTFGPGITVGRAVNAALQRTAGIKKHDNGYYSYEEPEVDPDDSPF